MSKDMSEAVSCVLSDSEPENQFAKDCAIDECVRILNHAPHLRVYQAIAKGVRVLHKIWM